MQTFSRGRLIVLLFFLPTVAAAAWGARFYLKSQVSADTQALIKAVQANDDAAVVFLLNHGADPNVRDKSGNTPLGNAVLRDRLAIAGDLLAHGADVNERTEGETVLFWAATGSNANAALVRQLISHGADVNVQEDGFHQTVLMRVVDDPTSGEQIAIIRAILASHPRLELRDMGGDTAWRIASKAGNKKVATLLKQAGAVQYSILPAISVRHAAYSIMDLGLGQANALNNHGDVVGQAFDGGKDANGNLLGQAFIWHQNHLHVMKPFHGPFSVARCINDWEQVVGDGAWASLGPYHDEWTTHAFLWQNGAIRDLHPRSGWPAKNNAIPSSAVAVNRNGLVALSVNSGAFSWRNGQWQELTRHGDERALDTAVPVAMNDTGQMAFYLQASGWEHGGVWGGGKLTILVSPDNGPVTIERHTFRPSLNDYAYGINDYGVIVGDDDDREALLWRHGKPTVLPGLYHHGEMDDEMRAEHINNRGQIVGTVSDDLSVANPEQHAVLWQGRRVADLNSFVAAASGWVLEDARGINEKGQIVGRGTYHGKEHAFLLTPLTGFKRVY